MASGAGRSDIHRFRCKTDVGCWLCAVKTAGLGLLIASALTPLASMRRATFPDTQSPPRRSPSPRVRAPRRRYDPNSNKSSHFGNTKACRRRRHSAARATARIATAGCPGTTYHRQAAATQQPRGPQNMIGRSTKSRPHPPRTTPAATRAPGAAQRRRPKRGATASPAQRGKLDGRKPGPNAHASVYVPHFMQENQQRIPGKPFEFRVHVRMKNKDLVHVFSDLTEDQTFLSLRELCRKTFPTFGRRLSALEWHADGVRVCPSFMAGRMATLQQCGLADARRVEAGGLWPDERSTARRAA